MAGPGRPPKKASERLDKPLFMRLDKRDMARLDALVKRIGVSSRNGVARAAMRIGIEAMEANPALFMGEVPKVARKRKR